MSPFSSTETTNDSTDSLTILRTTQREREEYILAERLGTEARRQTSRRLILESKGPM